MSIDGFEPAHHAPFVSLDEVFADRVFAMVDDAARRLHVSVDGIDRLPPGRALLVANHAFGWDVIFLMAAIRRATGRTVWALGEHLWWRVPFVRGWAARCGTVDGTRANAEQLLERDQLVLVLPGGMREAVKPRELRYHLVWGHRYGFVRTAIRTGSPLVPVACVGADEMFDLIGDANARGRRWLGRLGLPLPRPAGLLPVPHFRHLRYVVGDPVEPRVDASAASDPITLKRVRREVAGALHELIEEELARRAGIDLEPHVATT
jgi:1-acyl-sn-glycerol-3-phosphate acyltransferase